MTRNQKLTIIGAAIGLFTATVAGYNRLEKEDVTVGTIMLLAACGGWIFLFCRVRIFYRRQA